MSDTEKRPYAQVLIVANAIVDILRPHCHRIELAGSLRRCKELVGDIEIVAIPKLHTNLIGEPMDSSEVDDKLAGLPIALHKNGNKYKAFSFEWQAGWTFKVDLFLQPDPATWPVNFLLRTGSSEFSKRMVTSVAFGGHKPDAYQIKDARVWFRGAPMELTEEIEIFDLWGMAYVEPCDRA